MKKELLYVMAFVMLCIATPALAQYANPILGNNNCTHGDYITGVVMGKIKNTNTGCAGYGDYTNQRTTLYTGTENTIAITIHSEYHEAVGVFIDWNQDFDFADEGEFFSNGYVTVAGETEYITIKVPADAKTGTTRMRVVCQYGSPVTKENYNRTTSSFGEYEDYSLVIEKKAGPTENGEAAILEVYPNPTAKTAEVFTNLIAADFTLTDAKGTTVQRGALESGMKIDLSEFQPGVYALTVKHKDKTLVKRIVKQ